MAASESSHPLGELLSGLVTDVSMLFRKEIELAKTEASEKLDALLDAGRSLAIGAVLAIGAIGVFLAALVSGLTALLVGAGMQPTLANSIAALIVTIIVGGAAWALIAKGAGDLKSKNLNMERTAHSLKADAAAVKESI